MRVYKTLISQKCWLGATLSIAGGMSFVMGVYVLLIGYGGSLISVLTVNVFPPPMRTMRELADNIHDHVGLK